MKDRKNPFATPNLIMTTLYFMGFLLPIVMISIVAYSTVEGSMLYGTDSDCFYIIRYLVFFVIGMGFAVVGAFLPIQKLSKYWNKKTKFITAIGASIFIFCYYGGKIEMTIRRIPLWLNPYTDPDGAGYLYVIKNENLDVTRWFGRSEVVVYQEMITGRTVDYIMAVLGIIPTLLLFVLLIGMMIYLARQAMNLTDKFSKYVSLWIVVYFSLNIIGNLLFAFNLIPLFPSYFAFVSYDRIHQIIDGFLLGVIFGLFCKTQWKNNTIPVNSTLKKVIDIYSKSDGVAGRLSNFTERKFVFEGIECHSIEGILQSLKFKDIEKQKEICAMLPPSKAKEIGTLQNWKDEQLLYWNGDVYERESEKYYDLIHRIFVAVYTQDENFRNDLKETKGCVLTHSIGVSDPKETILTEEEFISILTRIRDSGLHELVIRPEM